MLPVTARQVGVGRNKFYALTNNGDLIIFDGDLDQEAVLMQDIKRFAAGDHGVLAITDDHALWWLSEKNNNPSTPMAFEVVDAAVGDGANYYITAAGDLFVKGRAHRGQYGDGLLTSTSRFVKTESEAKRITAHTGHAILLLKNGNVLGTGGNIYGPVGIHGLGDKAICWSHIMSGAASIATGSSHSLAIRPDGALVAWGRGYDPEPGVHKGLGVTQLRVKGTDTALVSGVDRTQSGGLRCQRHQRDDSQPDHYQCSQNSEMGLSFPPTAGPLFSETEG